MPELQFDALPGTWSGNDYPSVSITSVKLTPDAKPLAFIFMTHMNVDFDGAPNAYGPAEKSPLDSLDDAGRYAANGYYGLVAVGPKEVVPHDPHKRLIKDVYHLQLDTRYPDTKGRCPIVQQSGVYAGYFVSTTSKPNPAGSPSIYEQSHYLDSSAIAYSALSYGLQSKGVGDGDLGIAMRFDTFRTTSFSFLGGEGHGKGSAAAGAVGECSYKTFLDIGGPPKTRAQKYANNNFPAGFIVFPGSRTSQLTKISSADNALDFAVFLALQAQADRQSRGSSALHAFRHYVKSGRKMLPDGYGKVLIALLRWGYKPGGIGVAANIISQVATAVGKAIP